MAKKLGFLSKLLNLADEYEKIKRKHVKAGPVKKVFQMLLLLGLAVAGLYLTYLSFGLFIITKDMSFEIIVRIIGGAILLLVAAIILYNVIGYMFMFALLFLRYKKPKSFKNKPAQTENAEGEAQTEVSEENVPANEQPTTNFDKQYSKTSRAFDITFGCLYIVFAVALVGCVVGAIALGFKNNPFNIK